MLKDCEFWECVTKCLFREEEHTVIGTRPSGLLLQCWSPKIRIVTPRPVVFFLAPRVSKLKQSLLLAVGKGDLNRVDDGEQMLSDDAVIGFLTGGHSWPVVFDCILEGPPGFFSTNCICPVSLTWHTSQGSQRLNSGAGIKCSVVPIEFGVSFLEDGHPPSPGDGLMGIDGIAIFAHRETVIDHDFDFVASVIEVDLKNRVRWVALVGENGADSLWVLGKRGSCSQEPAVAKLALVDTRGTDAIAAPKTG